jgi:hypothetical protein
LGRRRIEDVFVDDDAGVGAYVERRLVDEQNLDATALGGLDLLILQNLLADLDDPQAASRRRSGGPDIRRARGADLIGANGLWMEQAKDSNPGQQPRV